jgi:hypothetical protein
VFHFVFCQVEFDLDLSHLDDPDSPIQTFRSNEMDEPKECPTCGFEEGTDDCTCDPWMNLPVGETRMDYLVWMIPNPLKVGRKVSLGHQE